MRKYGMIEAVLAILSGLAVFAGAAQAQRPLIIVGGLNFAEIEGDDFGDTDTRTGFRLALGSPFVLSPRLAITPFVAFTERGYDSGNVSAKITYIELPVVLDVAVPLGETFSLNLSVGPRLGFNVGCQIETVNSSFQCDGLPGVGDPETIDYGVIGGAGLGLAISPRLDLGIGAGYDVGFADVFTQLDGRHRGPLLYAALTIRSGA